MMFGVVPRPSGPLHQKIERSERRRRDAQAVEEAAATSRRAVEAPKFRIPLVYHEQLIRAWADHYGVTLAEINGERRLTRIVRARHAIWFELWLATRLSLPGIARLFNRDHSTVLHGIRQHATRHGFTYPLARIFDGDM